MPELDDIRRELSALDAELAALGRAERAREHRESMRLLCERFEHRFESLAHAHTAAASLRRISSQPELLRQAPGALTAGTGFRRAILSLVQESTLMPRSASFETAGGDREADADAAEQALAALRERPVRLEHHMVESDVIRRRRAALVGNAELNARVDRHMAALLDWSSYVVAPLLSGATVIGMLHADRGPTEALDALDRDVLWEFTGMLSQFNESAALRRALQRERQALQRFIDRVTGLSVSLADAPITFAAYAAAGASGRAGVSGVTGGLAAPPSVVTPITVAGTGPGPGDPLGDDRLVLSGLLTRRELDVLRLLAEGGTNHTIADALVLADTTIKFHVNSILRKLRVANRAEAVARYLSLVGTPLDI